MTDEEILRMINALPRESRLELEEYVLVLKERSRSPLNNVTPSSDLLSEPFFGMWRGRKDMEDSQSWVRNIRETHWRNRQDAGDDN
jgi:hypothetical protein